jgi:hypothetical protein
MNAATCSKCGAPRSPDLAEGTARPPCPQCGGTSLTISMSIVESLSMSDQLSAELVPGNQARDWQQRWKLVQDEIQLIRRPDTGTMSEESIHASLQRLFSFFILAYHLKDALKDAAPGLGLKPSDIEDAVTYDPRLALLADLANLDKHVKLNHQARSGSVPVIEKISGADLRAGGGWQLSAKIKHGASILDGLVIAEDIVTAWRERLMAWQLI